MTETGAWHRTLCPYCGVGCGLLVKVTERRGEPGEG